MSTTPRDNESYVLCAHCLIPLQFDISRPGKEWWCSQCGEFTEFFDLHERAPWGSLTAEQQRAWFDGQRKQLERYEKEGILSAKGARELEAFRRTA